MTKNFVIGLIMLTSSIAQAQEAKTIASPVLSPTAYSNRTTSNPHHLISVSTEGLGWSGSGSEGKLTPLPRQINNNN